MKTCPICHARAFDDMDICYGCMHRFGKGDAILGSESLREGDAVRKSETFPGNTAGQTAVLPENDLSGAGGCDRREAIARRMPSESGSGGVRRENAIAPGRNLALTIVVPEGATGVKVAVDFDVPGDLHGKTKRIEPIANSAV